MGLKHLAKWLLTLLAYRGLTIRTWTLLLVGWKLDFSHLGAKRVGYARHQSPLKEVISRCAPYRPR